MTRRCAQEKDEIFRLEQELFANDEKFKQKETEIADMHNKLNNEKEKQTELERQVTYFARLTRVIHFIYILRADTES